MSTAKYCAKQLPLSTEIFTVHNGKVLFQRLSNDDHIIQGLQEDPRPSFHKARKSNGNQSEFGDSEVSEVDSNSSKLNCQNSESESTTDISCEELAEVETPKNVCIDSKKIPQRTVSFNKEDVTEQKPGWPLLRRSSLPTQKALDSRKMSVVQWVMNFPDRSPPDTPQSCGSSNVDSCSTKSESPLGRENDNASNGAFSSKSSQSLWSEFLDQEPGLPFELNFLEFTWFSYEVLRHATSNFSAENLIGKGGCSQVYKGTFLDGKEVAVKVLKSSKQAWKDFSQEVNIMSTMRHKNITTLLGVCVDNSELISVYEFMSKGSLEDNLHAENKEKSLLSWDARFTVAVGIAEALVYLHQGCPRPVIHRDVKTSNILLSANFEPQLSDFGLAIWGPNAKSVETYTDVVGTFGYLAPEYFMYGKVTDKLDVYSFGVVLLELLTRRKPINSSKGQESLVMWAKPRLQSGKLIKGILDPSLEGSVDEGQMQRMVLAAKLCLTRATRLRPNMDQILKLLKGEETMDTWAKSHVYDEEEEEEHFDGNEEELYPNSSAKKSHLSLALLDLEDDRTSCSSGDRSNSPHTLGDFLTGRCRRSSSFD
ncbi:probable receptor-like protein kinase At5g18500 isoform X2 [Chenopodium quinoa]|nr:probable receptor-like protein kinase At5g18500 isoform X2 [Chenopodium quinoa]